MPHMSKTKRAAMLASPYYMSSIASMMRSSVTSKGQTKQAQSDARAILSRWQYSHRQGAALSLAEKIVAHSPYGVGHEQFTRVTPATTPIAGIAIKSTSQPPIKSAPRAQVHSVFSAGTGAGSAPTT